MSKDFPNRDNWLAIRATSSKAQSRILWISIPPGHKSRGERIRFGIKATGRTYRRRKEQPT